jgi:hypothetical protein
LLTSCHLTCIELKCIRMGLSMENTFQSLFIIDHCRATKVAKIFQKILR